MTKRYLKKNISKRINKIKKTKKHKRFQKTRKNKYGGEPSEEYKKKNLFRRGFNNFIIQINNKRNVKQAVNLLIKMFEKNELINTLIPITSNGKPIDKETYSLAKKPVSVYDFVSPIIVIFENLTGKISDNDLIRILNAYFINSGNFNNLSSRFKTSPFKNELNKGRINNIKILLDKSNPFHIYEEGLDEETRNKLAELIPTEQKIVTSQEPEPEEALEPEEAPKTEAISEPIYSKLQLPYTLPDNQHGYNRSVVPDFWKPIFNNGEELLQIREKFMEIYALDRYKDDNQKRIKICDILETIVPGYFTRYTLDYREKPKTLINLNILNCFITLFYGMILYRLYKTKQDYLFMFKGGRALQLSLVDITDIGKYFSEDTDILIIPNKLEGSKYDLLKMENLSEHLGYLIKWIIPEEINVIVSLPTNPKNTNKDITKLLYNDDKLFKALSDIGFGEINDDIKKYFDNLLYSPIYIESFATTSLFITPTLDDMLSEKLFYYAKYLKFKKMLDKNEPIPNFSNLTKEECDYLIFKFKRAILKLVEAIIKRDYNEVVDFEKTDTSRLILRGFIGNFEDYTNEEKENTIISIFP